MASKQDKTELIYDDDEEGRVILRRLKADLNKFGTLVGFFGLHNTDQYEKFFEDDEAEDGQTSESSSSSDD